MSKETKYKVFLLMFSLLLALLIGEVLCRYKKKYITVYEEASGKPYFSPYKVHGQGWLRIMPQNTRLQNQGKEFLYDVKTNSEGLPDREYPRDKPAHTFRIATLGDSYTEGCGAVMDSSWPRLLHRLLMERARDSVEVMDCGVSGSDPVYECILLKQKILDYHPDLVIVALNRTDVEDCIVRGGFERFQKDGLVRYNDPPSWEWIYARSFLMRTIVNGGLGYNYLLLSPEQSNRQHDRAIQILSQAVDSLADLCRKNNCGLLLAFHPIGQDLRENKLELQPVLDHAQVKGISAVNVMDYFLKNGVSKASMDTYYWPIDGHNKPAGYLLFAKSLLDQVERQKSTVTKD